MDNVPSSGRSLPSKAKMLQHFKVLKQLNNPILSPEDFKKVMSYHFDTANNYPPLGRILICEGKQKSKRGVLSTVIIALFQKATASRVFHSDMSSPTKESNQQLSSAKDNRAFQLVSRITHVSNPAISLQI
ncbi:hypothetical protein Ancab_024381 [Ancistrocladus abbreviatus]